eukprot:scaffold88319_cov61-Phaeocystis_antarctica.AAC.2
MLLERLELVWLDLIRQRAAAVDCHQRAPLLQPRIVGLHAGSAARVAHHLRGRTKRVHACPMPRAWPELVRVCVGHMGGRRRGRKGVPDAELCSRPWLRRRHPFVRHRAPIRIDGLLQVHVLVRLHVHGGAGGGLARLDPSRAVLVRVRPLPLRVPARPLEAVYGPLEAVPPPLCPLLDVRQAALVLRGAEAVARAEGLDGGAVAQHEGILGLDRKRAEQEVHSLGIGLVLENNCHLALQCGQPVLAGGDDGAG